MKKNIPGIFENNVLFLDVNKNILEIMNDY